MLAGAHVNAAMFAQAVRESTKRSILGKHEVLPYKYFLVIAFSGKLMTPSSDKSCTSCCSFHKFKDEEEVIM